MIDLFKENIIESFNNMPIIYPEDNYQIAFSHEVADFYEILNQFEYSKNITLLRQLSIYDLIDFLEQENLTELIIPELDIFLYLASIDDLINELDTSITYQEILSHYTTTEVLHTYHQYTKKRRLFLTFLSSTCSCIMCRIISTI